MRMAVYENRLLQYKVGSAGLGWVVYVDTVLITAHSRNYLGIATMLEFNRLPYYRKACYFFYSYCLHSLHSSFSVVALQVAL